MERLGESHLCKTMGGAVTSITNIYSLVLAEAGAEAVSSYWLRLRHKLSAMKPLPVKTPAGLERAVERGGAGPERGVHVPGGQEEGRCTAPPQLARHTRHHSGQTPPHGKKVPSMKLS